MESSTCLYSQWFPGDSNNIADALSRDQHSTNTELCSTLLSLFPEQIPSGLIISELPKEILSWTFSILRQLPKPQQSSQELQRNINEVYRDGSPSYNPLESTTTSTLTILQPQNVNSSSVPFWKPSVITSSTKTKSIDLRQSRPNLVLPPWVTWHRPSRLLTDQILEKPEMESLHIFYANNSKDTAI